MEKLILTEWVFFFTDEQKETIGANVNKNTHDLKSWLLFTIVLPFLTYFFAVIMNLLVTPTSQLCKSWASIVNNGSLPIVAFGILSSGVPYLMEQMKINDDKIYHLRKRVMAIATVFMFLTSGLFLFQSISPNTVQLNNFQNITIFLLSVIFAWFAISTGIKMYLLQSDLNTDFGAVTNKKRDDLNDGLQDEFGDE